MSLSILSKDLEEFLNDLINRLPVYGPVEEKTETFSKYRFKKLQHAKELKLNYGPTVIPPKKYLFPAKGDLFRFEKNEIFPPTNKEIVLFGVNKRDGEGLFYLDEIMTKPIPEEDYQKRRELVKIVIIDSLPPSNALHCDLYLQKVDDGHLLAFPFSEFGEALVRKKYFGFDKNVGTISTRNLEDDVVFHPRLAEIIESSREHKIWDKLADKCFNCGICSYVCPLCYCFEIDDRVEITSNIKTDVKGARIKRWDSCMLPEFGKVSFKNFRPETKDRIYNWYFHKFVRMPRDLGFPGCVDCGRCIHFCPAKINFREVLKELIEDDKTSKLHSK
jgi:sulfhydrogenase subunit beta (sulfur reductase)